MTQNFVSSVGLRQCLAFLQTGNPDLVSGCLQHERTDLHQRFLSALQEQRPEVPCHTSPSLRSCRVPHSKPQSGSVLWSCSCPRHSAQTSWCSLAAVQVQCARAVLLDLCLTHPQARLTTGPCVVVVFMQLRW